MIVKDWARTIAEEIVKKEVDSCILTGALERFLVEDRLKTILEHIPMEPDTAYMPVPRCERCAWWEHRGEGLAGFCNFTTDGDAKMYAEMYDAVLTEADFGCVQWKEK